MRKPWFGPKRFGIGVSPKSWEGWLCTLLFIAICVILPRQFQSGSLWLAVAMLVVVTVFGLIIYLTYDGTRSDE